MRLLGCQYPVIDTMSRNQALFHTAKILGSSLSDDEPEFLETIPQLRKAGRLCQWRQWHEGWTVLMIDANILPDTASQYSWRTMPGICDAVIALKAHHAKGPLTGGIILCHPGIGGCLHDRFPLALASPLFRKILVQSLSSGLASIGGKEDDFEP